MQPTFAGTASLVQSIAGSLKKPAKSTVHKYIQGSGLEVKKLFHADKGQVCSIKSVDAFLDYFEILEENLKKIQHDQYLIFGVDEVGVQFAERQVHLVTSHEYFNKAMQNQTVHCTLTLCTSPAAGGTLMAPHFLFQRPEGDMQNLLVGVSDEITVDYNSTGYQDESTWLSWLLLFIIWKDK